MLDSIQKVVREKREMSKDPNVSTWEGWLFDVGLFVCVVGGGEDKK